MAVKATLKSSGTDNYEVEDYVAEEDMIYEEENTSNPDDKYMESTKHNNSVEYNVGNGNVVSSNEEDATTLATGIKETATDDINMVADYFGGSSRCPNDEPTVVNTFISRSNELFETIADFSREIIANALEFKYTDNLLKKAVKEYLDNKENSDTAMYDWCRTRYKTDGHVTGIINGTACKKLSEDEKKEVDSLISKAVIQYGTITEEERKSGNVAADRYAAELLVGLSNLSNNEGGK